MSITVEVVFSRALTDVSITDLLSGAVDILGNVVVNQRKELEARAENGMAWIAVSGTSGEEQLYGEKHLRSGEEFLFPPSTSPSALAEIAEFESLDKLARKIDEIIKTPLPAA